MDSERRLKRNLGLPDSVWLGQVAIDFAQPQLGVGSDATVFRCLHDGVPVAAKVLHSALIAPNNVGRNDFIAKFGRECSRLRQLSHPCVVTFIGVGQAPNNSPCLVVELMQESLADRIKADPADPFLQSLIYLLDVAAGLRYLHWQLLVHRDLKPQNILLAAGRAKIADVGLARSLHGDEGMAEQVMTRCPGTPNYMAPESLEEGKPYDDKLDMFALGAIILGVFNHREPRPKAKTIRILPSGRQIAMTELDRRSVDLGLMDKNHPTRPLIVSCLQDEPALRPTATQAHHQLMVIHQGFAGVDKPLLSTTQAEVVGRLDTLAAAQQENRQQQLERQQQLQQQHQEQISLLRQELRSQQATTESIAARAAAGAAETDQLRQQVEHQQQQILGQNRQMQLQQRQYQEQISVLRKEVHSQQAAVESLASATPADAPPRPRSREGRLNWEVLRDVVSRRLWRCSERFDSGRVADACHSCVCASTLFVVCQERRDVRVYKTTDLQIWTRLPNPPGEVGQCCALVSTVTHVHMVYRANAGDIFVASLKADNSTSEWEVSPSPCPAKQYWPAVAVLGSTVYLAGGLFGKQATTSWYTLDSKKWSTTPEGGEVPEALFAGVADQRVAPDLVLCHGKWYSAGGHMPGSYYGPALPLHVLAQYGDGQRWEETPLRSAPPLAGVISHNDWLFVAGGTSEESPRKTNTVFCIDPAANCVIDLPPLPEKGEFVTLAAFSDQLIAIGGHREDGVWHCNMFTLDISI